MASVAVTFNVDCSCTEHGEEVFLVGSHKKLGAWDPTEALPCTTSAAMFPRWMSKAAKLPNGSRIEFKVVIRGPRGNRWEQGENRLLQVELPLAAEAKKIVSLTWGQAGVKDAEDEDIVGALPTAGEFFRRTSSPGGDGPLSKIMEPGTAMQKRGSRHLCRNNDGQVNQEMTRTPSLLLINFEKFNEEAALHEKELDAIEERAQLNRLQRKMKSTHLIERMAKITDTVDSSKMVLLQGFNWESWRSGGGDWYSVIGKRIQMLHDMGFTDLWLPPCSQSVAPQGYLPSQLFNLDGSKYGSQAALETLLEKCHKHGIRCLADIVINHRCGDKQDSQGRWNQFSSGMTTRPSFAGVGDWGGWAITLGDQYSDGSGMHAPGKADGKFDAAPDIDHRNPKVQDSINIWLRWLRLQVGFDGWRFDFVKGYGAEFVGSYCSKSHPAWAVGELWTDMHYDHHGLCYNQDKHRQALVDWVNATGKKSTAFDFTTKGILQEACRLTQFWRQGTVLGRVDKIEPRNVPLGHLAEHRTDWVKKGPCKKYVDEEAGLPVVGAKDPALKNLSELRRGQHPTPAEDVGSAKKKKAKKKKKKERRKVAKDRGVRSEVPRQAGGTAASEDASHGREGGGARTGQKDASGPVVMNWVLIVLGPKQLQVRTLREMKTLTAALDQIAAGNPHMAADTLAQRLKALELSTTDWNRAQFMEPEGPNLLERDEAVLASKEWAGYPHMKAVFPLYSTKASPVSRMRLAIGPVSSPASPQGTGGLCVAVADENVPADKKAHVVTNGAGAVKELKEDQGTTIEARRFIFILCPMSDAMPLLHGERDTRPNFGQLTAAMAENESYLVLESEDLQSLQPLQLAPLLYPDLQLSQTGADQSTWHLDYLDEIRYLSKEIGGKDDHQRTLPGGEFLESENIVSHSYKKLAELIELSQGLFTEEVVDEFALRHVPTFGDRFCGKGSHLSKAAGLRGFDIEEPLDWNLAGCDWDFRTEAGKPRLEVREADGSLLRTHGAPEIWTFFGSSVVRASVTNEIVGTTGHLGSAQTNAMAEKAIKGLFEADQRGALYDLSAWCTEPLGYKAMSMDGLLYRRLEGGTRELQDDMAADWAMSQFSQFLESKNTQEEAQHFRWPFRHSHHTGCDARLTVRGLFDVGHRLGPCPAFHWLRRDVLSFRWKEQQHIDVLELTAFLTELRRPGRDPREYGHRLFCVIDSPATFFVLSKGRSSSKKLNSVCRRITAVSAVAAAAARVNRLRDCNGKPPGLIGWLPGYAVTFIDNHDTGSTQRHWPFPDDKVMMGYAYILTHPGIPSVFWDHIMDWGDEHRKKIASLLKARRDSGIPVDAPVNIQCADDTLYLAEIGQPPALRVALGPRPAGQPDMNYWSHGPNGHGYRVWVKRTATPQVYTSLGPTPEATPLASRANSPRSKKSEEGLRVGTEALTAETLQLGNRTNGNSKLGTDSA
ncbi:AMY1.4 [Symbiodinium microadriaticum]|nr:AMY1.4 [Symbiodinium microadriaticum]